jgi:hypothetical protein
VSELEGEIARYVIELDQGPSRVSVRQVRARLLSMLKFPREEGTLMDQDRRLNDPLDLWGRTPGWRCWVGRHSECEPLGADESCSCACGIGGHGLDQSGVRTEGCDCGHEGMGERWHSAACVWRAFWPQRIRQAGREAANRIAGEGET